jgi:hypothetical protein
MSSDEIRTQKALALLEFKEAEEAVARLQKEKDTFIGGVTAFASAIRSVPGNPSDEFVQTYQHLTAEAAAELLRKLHVARSQLADAAVKKSHFGL